MRLIARIYEWALMERESALEKKARGERREIGAFSIGAVISIIIGVVILGNVVGALWAVLAATDTTIQALTQTDAGTVMLKAMWPIVLIAVGIGIAAGVIMWSLKRMGLMQ